MSKVPAPESHLLWDLVSSHGFWAKLWPLNDFIYTYYIYIYMCVYCILFRPWDGFGSHRTHTLKCIIEHPCPNSPPGFCMRSLQTTPHLRQVRHPDVALRHWSLIRQVQLCMMASCAGRSGQGTTAGGQGLHHY